MRARSLKMRFVAVIAALLLGISFASAPLAQAASGFDYRGTVTIEAYYSVKDVVWKVDGIEYAIGSPFYFSVTADGFVLGNGGYIATDGTVSKAGLSALRKTKRFTELFKAALRRYLVDNEGYQTGSDQLNQALNSAVMEGQPKFTHYAVTGVGVGEQREDLKEIAVGTNSKERGYPAIFQLKSLKVPAYQVVAGAGFNSKSLWPLSSRFSGAEAKVKRIERSVDKHGNDMYPYFQVLRADDLVPGTQVISKSTPRQIRGMIGAGDYQWSDGADALFPMDAWIELAQTNNIPVTVLGRAPSTSPSATTPPPPVSASPSAAPTTATPSGTPSVSAQPTDQPVPPVNHGDNGWSMFTLGTMFLQVTIIGGIGIYWLLMLRRHKKAAKSAEDNAPQDESSEE